MYGFRLKIASKTESNTMLTFKIGKIGKIVKNQ